MPNALTTLEDEFPIFLPHIFLPFKTNNSPPMTMNNPRIKNEGRASRMLAPLCALLLLPLAAQETESRVWTNREGRTVKAKFVEMSGANVVLELENGSRSNVAMASLSDPDQVYLRTVHGAPESAPPAGGGNAPAVPVAPQALGPLVWPAPIAVNPKAIAVTQGKQDTAARQYHYQTGSFGFICNAPLAGTVMQEVAADFELTRAAIVAMPWGWQPKPKEGTLFKIYLTETEQDFIALGGTDGSAAGSTDDYAFIKFEAMGLKKVGPRYAYNAREKEPGRVIGMTTRLMIGDMRTLLYPWSAAGLEQFMRKVAYYNGGIRFSGLESALKGAVKEENELGVTNDLQRLVQYARSPWSAQRSNVKLIRMENQFDAMLLVYYFGCLDGDGSGAGLHQYYRDVAQEALGWRGFRDTNFQAERPRERDAGTSADRGLEFLNKLLAGRTDAQLVAEMAAKFRAIGIKFDR